MEKTSNGIELWAREFEELPRVRLDGETFVKFGFCLIAESANWASVPIRDKMHDALKKSKGLGSVIYNRVRCCHTYKISAIAAVFLGDYIAKTLGECTMLTNYIQYWAWKNGVRKITMIEIEKMFPDGYPTQEAWKKAWALQKVERDMQNGECSDNGLDYVKFGESIREIKEKAENE